MEKIKCIERRISGSSLMLAVYIPKQWQETGGYFGDNGAAEETCLPVRQVRTPIPPEAGLPPQRRVIWGIEEPIKKSST
jgi:hypothetical protein